MNVSVIEQRWGIGKDFTARNSRRAMHFSTPAGPVCFLVDNGSLRPDATRELRRLAAGLAGRLGWPVEPVSLLHSDRVPADALDGTRAEVFTDAVRRRHAGGARDFVVVPLFFGPSGALTEYLPREVAKLRDELGPLGVRQAAPVAGAEPDAPDARLVDLLADHARAAMRAQNLESPAVVLVDHGSPQRAVASLRDRLAERLSRELGNRAREVVPASMERREGEEFSFNEPLLAHALRDQATRSMGGGGCDVVLVPLFFSPGRHAGPGGDIGAIVQEAGEAHPGLRVHFTALVGEHPGLLEILADRYHAAVASG
jgi:sirohydrochlorin ferrochelatase